MTPKPQTAKRFKRGATFKPTCTLPLKGSLTSLVGVTIASAVVTTDGKVHSCTVSIPDVDGRKFVLQITDTSKWPVGDAIWDIKFTLNGVVVYTETILLHIVKSATP
jgi:hypothetical protein